MIDFPQLHEDVDFEVVNPNDFFEDIGFSEIDLNPERCIWDGFKMVTIDEYENELFAMTG